jgi:hypothetical protein
MSMHRLAQRVVFVGIPIGLISCAPLPSPTPGPDPEPTVETTYIGETNVFRAEILGRVTSFVEASLDATGGASERSALTIDAPGLVNAEVAHAAVVGGGGVSRAEASLAFLNLTVGDHTITADFLMSRVEASCGSDNIAVTTGSFEVANMKIDDQSITVTTGIDQGFDLRDLSGAVVGRVTLNEQANSTGGASGEMTVNALHVEVFGAADVVMFRAFAGVNCATSEPGDETLTGGGRISGTPSGGVGVFGVAGGQFRGDLWGHLNYVDKDADIHVRGVGVTAYEPLDSTTRRITGDAEINGVGGFTYEVIAVDNGEPGTADRFELRLSSGYEASGALVGGNIQIHRLNVPDVTN